MSPGESCQQGQLKKPQDSQVRAQFGSQQLERRGPPTCGSEQNPEQEVVASVLDKSALDGRLAGSWPAKLKIKPQKISQFLCTLAWV